MFIQIIDGTIGDREGVERLGQQWNAELRPGAGGFLGATIGITDDDRIIDMARFSDRSSAEANAERAEQGEWWTNFEKCFSTTPRFRETSEVLVYRHGDLDTAGFVQVMEGRVHDAARARAFFARAEEMLPTERPDLLGVVELLHGDGTFTDLAYFSSEAAARAGESQSPSAEVEQVLAEMAELYEVTEYLDLRRLWLF